MDLPNSEQTSPQPSQTVELPQTGQSASIVPQEIATKTDPEALTPDLQQIIGMTTQPVEAATQHGATSETANAGTDKAPVTAEAQPAAAGQGLPPDVLAMNPNGADMITQAQTGTPPNPNFAPLTSGVPAVLDTNPYKDPIYQTAPPAPEYLNGGIQPTQSAEAIAQPPQPTEGSAPVSPMTEAPATTQVPDEVTGQTVEAPAQTPATAGVVGQDIETPKTPIAEVSTTVTDQAVEPSAQTNPNSFPLRADGSIDPNYLKPAEAPLPTENATTATPPEAPAQQVTDEKKQDETGAKGTSAYSISENRSPIGFTYSDKNPQDDKSPETQQHTDEQNENSSKENDVITQDAIKAVVNRLFDGDEEIIKIMGEVELERLRNNKSVIEERISNLTHGGPTEVIKHIGNVYNLKIVDNKSNKDDSSDDSEELLKAA